MAAMILFVIVFAVAAIDTVKMFNGEWQHHDWLPFEGKYIEWRQKMAAVCVIYSINTFPISAI